MLSWLSEQAPASARAVYCAGRWYGYHELHQRARAVSALVQRHARSSGGARTIVPILGGNSFALAAAYLGVQRAGAIPALLPPLSADATAIALREMQADLVFADPDRLGLVRSLGAGGAMPIDEPLPSSAGDERGRPFSADELALLLYTSGSTGTPRGVMLSAGNLAFNAAAILDAVPIATDDRTLLSLPLHYCYGLSVLHTHLARGAAVVLTGSVLPGALLDLIVEGGVTGLPAVPSLVQSLLRSGNLGGRLTGLRWVMTSGGKLPEHDVRTLLAAVPQARVHLRYGITETTAAASFVPPARLADKLGSIGPGLPGAPLRVLREDGSEVARDGVEVGEIVVAGAHVALGYLGDPTETARSFGGGTYRTGDLARVDTDGYVYIVGRTRSFVKTGGHRVAVEEIEDVLSGDPTLLAAAVCGVPHPTRGEALIAFVVARPGEVPAPAALRARCAAALPAFKVPVEINVIGELPRTASGKLDRAALRANAARAPR